MNLGSSIRINTAWLFSGKLTIQLINFIVGIILARILAPEDFGILVTIQVFTGAAGFIAGGGMGQALIQTKEISKQHFQVVLTLQFMVCTLIYFFFYFIAPYFSIWFATPIYENLLRISALSFVIRPFINVANSKLSREMRFKALTINSLASLTISSTTSIYLALNDFGTWSLIYGGLIGAFYSAISLTIISKCYPAFYYEKTIAKSLGSYGIKFSANDIICYLRSQVPNVLIGKYMGPAAVGLFNKGDSLSELPVQTISGSAYQTIFRALSSAQDNLDQSKYIYLRTITLVTVYTFPFYIGLFWLSESFIVTVYGEKWLMAAIPLQILSIARLFSCVTNPSGAVMAAQNLLGIEIKITLASLILSLLGCIYGIQNENIALIAIGLLPSYLFVFSSMTYYSLRQLNATYKDLFFALKPAFKLNIFLILILAITDIEIQIYLPYLKANEYLLALSGIGGISYILLFLFYPIPDLEKETLRWKKLLRLPINQPTNSTTMD